jgi:UPF0755 protein
LDGAAKQVGLVKDLDPGATSLEGYLFPDTYHFPASLAPAQICAAMVKRFRAVAGQLGLKGNMHRVVTMASLVERETAVDAERPLVASVFENRLAKKMPLMTDPSVIYGLELDGRWRGAIYQSDLKLDTPVQHLSAHRPAAGSGGQSRHEVAARGDGAGEDRLSLLCGRRSQSPGAVAVFQHH